MTSDIEEKTFQSAAKLNCEDDSLEGSETIPKGSTQSDSSSISEEDCGSAALQTRNGEDDEIVRNKYFIEFIEKVNKKFFKVDIFDSIKELFVEHIPINIRQGTR